MTKEEINFVTEFVGKTIGTPASEAASLLFELKEDGSGELKAEALPELLKKDADRVKIFKDAETKAHDKGFNKAKGEALTKFESDLKEKYGISTDKQGVDLIETIVSEKVKSQGGELDDEKIKRSSLYLNTVDKLTKEKTEAVALEAKKYTDLENSIKKETTFKSVAQRIQGALDELKPILPEGKLPDGKTKAQIQIERFIKDLGSEFEFEEKDGKLLIIKDGKVQEDNHGHMIDFKELVKERASTLWDFHQGESRQGTGNNNDQGGAAGGQGYTGKKPSNDEEYLKMIDEAKTEEEKINITKAFTGKI